MTTKVFCDYCKEEIQFPDSDLLKATIELSRSYDSKRQELYDVPADYHRDYHKNCWKTIQDAIRL